MRVHASVFRLFHEICPPLSDEGTGSGVLYEPRGNSAFHIPVDMTGRNCQKPVGIVPDKTQKLRGIFFSGKDRLPVALRRSAL